MKAEEAKRDFADEMAYIRAQAYWMGEYEFKELSNHIEKRLNALLDEHYYPKEFTNWTHHQGYWHFDIITDMWYSDDDKHLDHEITTDELYNYWKENIK